MTPRVDPGSVDLVRGLSIDPDYLRFVVDRIACIGSSPLGYRTTGTPEDAAVADFVSSEMRSVGLADVAIEGVDVHGWRFRKAELRVAGAVYEASSFGGVSPTGPAGAQGRLVDVGTARTQVMDRLDLRGAVALMEWRNRGPSPYVTAFELMHRGAVAMVITCPAKGPWYQSADALGAFDAHWPSGAPPMIYIRKEVAKELRHTLRRQALDAEVMLDAEVTPQAVGHNVVGYLRGARRGPIVVGAHHDGWFRGAFDNASGVAVTLAMAKALVTADHRLPHDVCFSTRTGEEFGLADSSYDWCIGAWEQITTTHPEWSTTAPFHLCIEATGRPGVRAIIETSVELTDWSRRVCRAADAEGWLGQGWRVAPPVSGTELWPYLVSGVPSVATYAWETSFGHSDYHTQLDTADKLDFDHIAAQTRAYLLFLIAGARDPDGIIDHRARARQLKRISAKHSHDGLRSAASAHAKRSGRDAFTAVGCNLVALDANGSASHPHEQAERDVKGLQDALAAIDAGDNPAALKALRRVGNHSLFPYVSEAAMTAVNARSLPDVVQNSWARNSHLTQSPDLYRVIASLRDERGSRPHGPWIRSAISSALARSRTDLTRRLDAMARALDTSAADNRSRSS